MHAHFENNFIKLIYGSDAAVDPAVVKWLTRSLRDLTIAGSSRGRAVRRR